MFIRIELLLQQAKKFVSLLVIVKEHAQIINGYSRRVGVFNSATSNAKMASIDFNGHILGMKNLRNFLGDLLG